MLNYHSRRLTQVVLWENRYYVCLYRLLREQRKHVLHRWVNKHHANTLILAVTEADFRQTVGNQQSRKCQKVCKTKIHCVTKNVPPLNCYNLDIHDPTTTIFLAEVLLRRQEIRRCLVFPHHMPILPNIRRHDHKDTLCRIQRLKLQIYTDRIWIIHRSFISRHFSETYQWTGVFVSGNF